MNDQGKTQQQREGSYAISYIAFAILVAMIAVLAILNHYGLLPEAGL
jgi:hypothetical protein